LLGFLCHLACKDQWRIAMRIAPLDSLRDGGKDPLDVLHLTAHISGRDLLGDC